MQSYKLVIPLLTLIAACILFTGGCNLFKSPDQSFNDGLRLWRERNYRQAITQFDDAIQKHPEAAHYRWRAEAHSSLGEYRAAISDYNKAIELDNSNVVAAGDYEGRGNIHLSLADHLREMEQTTNSGTKDSLGFYKKAIEDYSKAIELNAHDSATAYANRGTAYFRLGYYPLALNDYDQTISRKPERALTYISRGRALYFLHKYEQSLENLTRGIDLQLNTAKNNQIEQTKLKPFYANAYRYRSETYEKLGKTDLAAKDKKTAEEFDY